MQNRSPFSHFAFAKSDIDIKRSQFTRSNRHLTTMSAGLLYPLLVDEVLPGDTYSIDMSSLVRMSTPIHPVMDNCFLDTYWFFVPNRIVWEHWKEFMGESPDAPYINPIEYSVPKLYANRPAVSNVATVLPKSVLDYMGIPAGTLPKEINALPLRGFSAIWNEWFRDQNLQDPIYFSKGDTDEEYYAGFPIVPVQTSDYRQYTSIGGPLPPVAKYHDYFTSALTSPQKGPAVPIPLSGMLPVYASELIDWSGTGSPVKDDIKSLKTEGSSIEGGNILGVNRNGYSVIFNTDEPSLPIIDSFRPNNLVGDLSTVTGLYSTINDLRYAFQLQKFMEADNRGGTRYRELLRQHFSVISPDASQQIPEFLGGKRIPINMSQVLQTSATNDVSPQGNTAAYSLTSDSYGAFTKSFTEHGFIFCVGCIRTEHTYQNGIERMWSRFNKFDYYFPEFANIGEQPIYNREIYNYRPGDFDFFDDASWNKGDEVFGFQEAWADYRYKPNRISGEFRSTYAQSLDVWHYGDDYTELPTLSDEWIRETRSNIDRTLAVSDVNTDQFICDFYFKMNTTRVMPVNSIPGLADHH